MSNRVQFNSRVLRLKQLQQLTSLSASTIWRRVKVDPLFPQPFSISANATAWDEAEVMSWLEKCKAQRNKVTEGNTNELI